MNAPDETRIAVAETSDEIARCFEVMRELRAHLASAEEFGERVQRQQKEGYKLAYLEAGGAVRAVAGYRVQDLLFSGRTLYVDDLVTHDGDRSQGFGGQIFDWLVAEARREKCQILSLDSGVQRFAAHRFYLMKRMEIAAHHFTLALNP
ncbi:MAG: GNAT family N-acetyltransferase [Chthoniobacterales bacterium]